MLVCKYNVDKTVYKDKVNKSVEREVLNIVCFAN